MSDVVLSCRGLSKGFRDGKSNKKILDDVDFQLKAGERVGILGHSGSGKSTLLYLWGLLDKPSQGDIFIGGENAKDMSRKKRCQWRNRYLGFIYQFHHLLPEFSALENVMMPLLIRGDDSKQAAAVSGKERYSSQERDPKHYYRYMNIYVYIHT